MEKRMLDSGTEWMDSVYLFFLVILREFCKSMDLLVHNCSFKSGCYRAGLSASVPGQNYPDFLTGVSQASRITECVVGQKLNHLKPDSSLKQYVATYITSRCSLEEQN
ncbi:hypothetical protein STEG23_004230 [Scotinomys teguina]